MCTAKMKDNVFSRENSSTKYSTVPGKRNRKSPERSQEVKSGRLGLNPESPSSQESTLLLSFVSSPELFINYLFLHNLFIEYLLYAHQHARSSIISNYISKISFVAPKTQCLGEELEFFIYLLQKNLWKGTERTQLTSLFKMVAEVSYQGYLLRG